MTETGYFVRVQRNGKWQSLDIADLTEDEFDTFSSNQGPERGWVWAKALAGWIRDNVATQEQPE